MSNQPDPANIMQTATAFWASKVLLTAVEMDLFSTLGDGSMTAPQLGEELELHPRGTYDFFDALVVLKFLDRDGDGPQGRYKNTPEDGRLPGQEEPEVYRWNAGNAELTPVWILEQPGHRAQDGAAAKRGEDPRQTDVRGAVRQRG